MNSLQAKKIKIFEYLDKIGINPVRKYGDFYYYRAPYRKDTDPSLKVNTDKNIWYDLGTGAGGNIIDLVMAINSCGFSEALNILSNNLPVFCSFQPSNNPPTQSVITIKHVQPLQNKALIQYCQRRKIPSAIAEKYLLEADYTTYPEQIKTFFAIAFKNNSGGYELRNDFKTVKQPDGTKIAASPKDITTIESSLSNSVNIFEGFFDFLSALTYYKTIKPTHTTIILNSVGNINKTSSYISGFKTVNLFLDNDNAGANAVKTYQNLHPNVINQSIKIFPGYKDFNEFLVKAT